MRHLACDLHLHSCLSPCGDDSMTPAAAAGMEKLAGVDAAALTDHNTTRNCPAFFKACDAYGVSPLAGMELTTAEDIHLICLFLTCEDAAAFEEAAGEYRVHIKNKPGIFGNQLIMNEEDEVIGEEPDLLPNALRLDIVSAFELAEKMGGVCYPAHVDRMSNGIIAALGTFPEHPKFRAAEFRDPANVPEYLEKYTNLQNMRIIYGSDSHRLEDIPEEAEFFLDTDEGGTPAEAVFRFLKGE